MIIRCLAVGILECIFGTSLTMLQLAERLLRGDANTPQTKANECCLFVWGVRSALREKRSGTRGHNLCAMSVYTVCYNCRAVKGPTSWVQVCCRAVIISPSSTSCIQVLFALTCSSVGAFACTAVAVRRCAAFPDHKASTNAHFEHYHPAAEVHYESTDCTSVGRQ